MNKDRFDSVKRWEVLDSSDDGLSECTENIDAIEDDIIVQVHVISEGTEPPSPMSISSSSSTHSHPLNAFCDFNSPMKLDFQLNSDGLENGLLPYDAYLLEDAEINRERSEKNNEMRSMLSSFRNRPKPNSTPQSLDLNQNEILKVNDLPEEQEEALKPEDEIIKKSNIPSWIHISGPQANAAIRNDSIIPYPFLRLHEEINMFANWIHPTKLEEVSRGNVIHRFEKAIHQVLPGCNVDVFGSYYTGLYLPIGDIDICISSIKIRESEQTILFMIGNALLDENLISAMEIIDGARVPIIKCIDRITNLSVDICIEQSTSATSTRYVLDNLTTYPVIRPLLLLLKVWLYQRNFHETYKGGIGSYLLFLMVLGVVKNNSLSQSRIIYRNMSLGHLLYSFFDFWANIYNYNNDMLDLTKPNVLLKRDYSEDQRSRLCVRNPLDRNIDLGKNSFEIRKIRNAFIATEKTLFYLLSRDAIKHSILFPFLLSASDPMIAHRVGSKTNVCALEGRDHQEQNISMRKNAVLDRDGWHRHTSMRGGDHQKSVKRRRSNERESDRR